MPQTIKAKAIGMPRAIAPSKENVNTAMVMAGSETRRVGFRSGVLVALFDGDKFLFCGAAAKHAENVVQEDDGGRDAEDKSRRIKEEADRDSGRGRPIAK